MSYTRLFTGLITDDFDSSKDLVMGPWCFQNKEEGEKWNIDRVKFENTFPPLEMEKYAKLNYDLAYYFIQKNYLSWNEKHALNVSVRYWELLLGDIIIHLLSLLLHRYFSIEKIIRKEKNNNLEVYILNFRDSFIFNSFNDFVHEGLQGQEVNAWVVARLIQRKKISQWKIISYELDGEQKKEKFNETRFTEVHSVQTERQVNFKAKVRSFILMTLKKSKFRLRVFDVYGLSRVNRWILSAVLFFKKGSGFKLHDNLFTKEHKDMLEVLDIDYFFEKIVIRDIEKIKKDFTILLKNAEFQKRGIFIVGPDNLISNNIYFTKILVEYELGSQIISTQHGAGYGVTKISPYLTMAEYDLGAFITWGWKNIASSNSKFIALPSPYLNSFSKWQYNEKIKVVLVGALSRLFLFKLYTSYTGFEEGIIEYRFMKSKFISNLNEKLLNNFYYKPYSNNKSSLRDRDYFTSHFKDLKILEGHLHTHFKEVSLIILDHPGTTLNIAMAMNMPVICFWKKDDWLMDENAQPYFDELEKAGILFYDPILAAEKVNEVYESVVEWWSSKPVQTTRKKWADRYALTSRFWLLKWIWAMIWL